MSITTPDAIGVRTYSVDPAHSSVTFTVRHLLIGNVHGSFAGISGTLNYDPANKAASTVEIDIDASTINTRNADRDAHIKSADFLEVSQFPTIKFVSTTANPSAGDAGEIAGNLTIKGITEPVTLVVDEESPEVADPMGNARIAFAAHTKIKRSDYGVIFNMPLASGGLVIGEELKVAIDIQFIRKP